MFERGKERMRTVSLWLAAAAITLTSTSTFAQAASDSAAEKVAPDGPLPEWEEFVEGVLAIDLFNIPVWRLGLSLLMLLLGFSLRGFLLDKLLTPFKLLFGRTETEIDDRLLEGVRGPLGWVVNLVAVYFALLFLEPPASLMTVATLVLQTIGTVLVAWVVYRVLDVGMHAMLKYTEQTESEMDDQLVPLVMRVARVVLFIIVGIAIIQQWGYDVTSLIAGLGIGGLAFALAAKPTLSNWFGSLMIFTDRPFKMGDWVRTDVGEGIVEEVGLRSTKIRTFSDTLITVPNADIATRAVENCSAMKKRRLRTHIGLVYGTTSEQMDEIIAKIKQRILDDERIEDESMKVFFEGFGASSLDVLVQCWMLTTAYDEFMEIKQALLLDVMAIVEDAGSGFAFPSQSVYLENAVRFEGAAVLPGAPREPN
jgi:MscS family membrane protein